MIYIDSCIPMYLVGREHPNKQRTMEMVSRLVEARETLVTSAEVFQEIIHRYKGISDFKHLNAAYEALEEMATLVFDVTKKEVDLARTLSIQHSSLSSRDCLHVALMKQSGCRQIWTFDTGFNLVPSLQRIS